MLAHNLSILHEHARNHGEMKANKAGLREKLERFSKRFREKHEPSANEQPSIDTVTGPSIPPAETEPVTGPSPKLSEQSTSQMGLWGKAAASLNPGDRDTLERLIKSKREYHDGPRPVSLANEVDSTLSRAKKLKEEDKEATWRPVSPLWSQSLTSRQAQQVDES